MTQPSFLNFRAAWAKYKDLIYCVGYHSPLKAHDYFQDTVIAVMDEQESTPWEVESFEKLIFIDVSAYKAKHMERPSFVALDERGFMFIQNDEILEEIADSGLKRPSSKNYGPLVRVRPIQDTLYVVGMSGQILRRRAKDRWEHFDQGLLKKKDEKKPLLICDIACNSSGDFYAIDSSRGAIFFRKASSIAWEELKNPSRQSLTEMAVDHDGSVLIVGQNGTLLKGNRNGFTSVKSSTKNAFTSLTKFRNKWILASTSGLYHFDGKRLIPLTVDVSPEARSFGRLQTVDDVLWSFGKDDILRFQNKAWERILPKQSAPF